MLRATGYHWTWQPVSPGRRSAVSPVSGAISSKGTWANALSVFSWARYSRATDAQAHGRG